MFAEVLMELSFDRCVWQKSRIYFLLLNLGSSNFRIPCTVEPCPNGMFPANRCFPAIVINNNFLFNRYGERTGLMEDELFTPRSPNVEIVDVAASIEAEHCNAY